MQTNVSIDCIVFGEPGFIHKTGIIALTVGKISYVFEVKLMILFHHIISYHRGWVNRCLLINAQCHGNTKEMSLDRIVAH